MCVIRIFYVLSEILLVSKGLSQKHEFENKQNTEVGTSNESLYARKATQLLCI